MTTLLGPLEIRQLADRLQLTPTKAKGQNFVIDPNTVRRIVAKSRVTDSDDVVEVGPGLGSLTLSLLAVCRSVQVIELDALLAAELPATVHRFAPNLANKLQVYCQDALAVTELAPQPTALVANLPYNVAVPILLTMLARFPSITSATVMVQKEVADRLVAAPGSKLYGIPSAKVSWYGNATAVGTVPPTVFWPAPRVDSGLVRIERRPIPTRLALTPDQHEALRLETFAAIDAAFAQRRKVLRTTLAAWAGSKQRAVELLEACGISPTARGEELQVRDFQCLASRKNTT